MSSSQSLQSFTNQHWCPLLVLVFLSHCHVSKSLSPIHPKNDISSNKSTHTKPFVTRQEVFKSIIAATTTTAASIVPVSNAAETVGKDPLCNTGSCLGVW